MRFRFEAKTKRVLSLVLTLAVILCSIALVPVRATSANGGGTPFYIGWGSPAIPMYENKYVDLKKTAVQFEKNGDFVNGNDIEWSLDAQETAGSTDIILDNSNKTLMAFSSGRYVLNATSAGKSARIYVLVNKQGDEEFVLENQDFRTQNYDADKWYSGRHSQLIDNYYLNGCAYTYQSKPWYTVTGSRLYVGGGGGSASPLDYGNPIVMYDSDILNDFADYTVSAKVVLENSWGEDLSSRPNFSIIARGNINKADRTEGENVLDAASPSLFLTLRGYGGLCVVAKTSAAKQELSSLSHGDTLYTPSAFDSDEAAVSAISQGGEYVTSGHIDKTRVVEMKLSGNDVKYSLDGQVVFDSTAANNKFFRFNEVNEQGMSAVTTGEYNAFNSDMANLNTGKGTVGFATGRRIVSIYDFKVTLNTDTMPEMSDIYFVKNSQPSIPMYAGTAIELDDLFIQFGDGTYKAGNYLTWQLNSGSNTLIDTTNGYLIAVSEGISSYIVTSGSKSCKVYVMVNEKGNSEFILENIDFSADGFDSDKWYSGRHGQLLDNYYINESTYLYKARPWYTAQNGKLYLGGNGGGTSPYDFNNNLAMYDSEILKDFADYTISAKVAFENISTDNLSSKPNFSIVARGKINKADRTEGETVLEAEDKALFLTLRGYGGLCVVAKTPAAAQELGSLSHGDTLYTPSAFGSDETAITELSQGGTYATSGHVGTVRNIEMKLSGDRIRYTLDGQVIFDSEAEGNKYFRFGANNEQGMSAVTTGEYTNYHTDISAMDTGKGTVGFATGRRFVTITECKVTLNVESMPKAKDIFVVKDSQPAIPMYEETAIDFADLLIQFPDGTYTLGNNLSWQPVTAAGTMSDSTGITALTSGTAVYNVSDSETTRRVYVIVNENGNNEFVLENIDFSTNGFSDDDWYTGRHSQLIDNYYINGCSYVYMSKPWYTAQNGKMYVGGYDGGTGPLDYGNPVVMYNSDILNDFADYTVSAKFALENTYSEDLSSRPNFSIVARGRINKADRTAGENVFESDSSALFLTLRSYGGLCVVAKSPSGKQELGSLSHGDTLYTPSAFASDEAAVAAISEGGDYVTSGHIGIVRDVEMKLSGNNIRYTLDGQVIFDSEAEGNKYFRFNESNEHGMSTATTGEYANYNTDISAVNTGKGTIGFATGRRFVNVTECKVTLNIDRMPEYKEVFIVKDSQPAIPIYVRTMAELRSLVLQFPDGTYKLASAVEWQKVSGNSTTLNVPGTYLVTAQAGTDVYTVTSGNNSSKVYVIVNEKGNNEFVLENIDFSTQGFDNNKWYSGRHTQLIDNYYLSNSEYTYQSKPWYTAQNDKMYLGAAAAGTYNLDYNNTLAMYDSDILGDFADYTVKVKVTYENINSDDMSSRPNFSIVARGNINKADRTQGEYVLDSASQSLFLTLRGYGGLCLLAKSPAGTQKLGSLSHGDTLYTPSAFASDEAAVTGISEGGNYTMAGHVGTVRDIEMKLSGNDVKYSLDGQVIFDSAAENSKYFRFGVNNEFGMSAATTGEYNAFNNDMANLNTGKGTIGFATGRRFVTITECKVILNVEKMPVTKERQYRQDFDEFLGTQNFSAADDEFYSRLDGLVGDLKDIIYNNTNDLRSKNGVNYYVSNEGDDTADGKSPQTAWKTLAKVNSYTFNAGDAVLLRRGDTWYENINAQNGVSYSAYGTGTKPRVFKAYNAMQGTWVLTDTPNIWRYEQTFDDTDIGNVVFNDGAFCGQRKFSVEDMTENLDFFISNQYAKVADTENKLYLRCEAGNPQDVFSQIDISRAGSIILIAGDGHDIAVNNLELRYAQDIAFMQGGKNISFSYCVCGWTGGTVFDNEAKARYGGGAGGWLFCENFSFEYCHIYEQWDSGVTPQYSWRDEVAGVFKNFTTTDCLFEGCQYTLEYFHTQKTVTDNGFDNMQFNYNICLDGGRGFGTDTQERVDASAYVKSWGHENTCVNSAITHNIFDRAAALSIEIIGHNFGDSDKDVCYNSIPKLYRNMYIEPRNKEFANINRIRYKFNEDTYRLLELLGVDKDSVYIYSE